MIELDRGYYRYEKLLRAKKINSRLYIEKLFGKLKHKSSIFKQEQENMKNLKELVLEHYHDPLAIQWIVEEVDSKKGYRLTYIYWFKDTKKVKEKEYTDILPVNFKMN